MPETIIDDQDQGLHSDDMKDIVTAVPHWLLRWGISVFFFIVMLGIALSAFIRYPDILKARLTISSPDVAKPVVSKVSGKLVALFVTDKQKVKAGQTLAYLESTADHDRVLQLLKNLEQMQQDAIQNKPLTTYLPTGENNMQLGELQSAYQTFFIEYLNYLSSVNSGFFIKKRKYLEGNLASITQQQQQLLVKKKIEQRDSALAQQNYDAARKLFNEKVETKAEFRQAESQYLSKKSPLIQTETSLINGKDSYASKQKELLELDNDIQQGRSKFLEALNSLISSAMGWKTKYVLSAPENGRVTFVRVVQPNSVLQIGQEVLYVNPGNEQFFGDMAIPQTNIGKVKVGQQVLIKLKGYPYQEFGMLRGTIKNIADIPYQDSVFASNVAISVGHSSDLKKPIHLKQGMTADAEIVTENATVLQRIGWSLFRFNR
ncbi:HlyD family secretion protein [Mucilaginibacter oryzae]|uniref:HlyD family secretion protein n=1 Tax=Mucilaginibacter oryzae TaxID=468058 RepID=A0A316HBJ8_9SPHI|nr:HlyD family efflux transporter periplasmic adaptor subunit [Mucilaginibacter oryzae]PWK77663.1 HlyD family secretion protein [Mucilaginibacter oryzae]